MEFKSNYVSHQPDANGLIQYSEEENKVWHTLFSRQKELLPGRACDEYLQGLAQLNFQEDKIPQLPEINHVLLAATGWQVAPVAALISARAFFELLANRRFPAATFIRTREELEYLKEPDIFHELFGHCPMLTNSVYADFMQKYAQIVLGMPESDWPLLQRLFWFTVEFGLIRTPNGLRVYGGGILSSVKETVYSVESHIPMRAIFDPIAAFRTPYRIDQLQPIYFVINHYQELYDFVISNIQETLKEVKELGEFPPFFTLDEKHACIHIHAC